MSKDRSRHIHLDTVHQAGLPRISLLSVVAGMFAAYGMFAVLAAIAGAIANSADAQTEFRTNDWTGSGAAAALISAGVLLLSYLFGGYVAGRMARRSGVIHGLAVFVLTLVTGAVAGGLVSLFTDNDDVRRNLRSIGVPTTTDQVTGVAVAGAIVSLAAILVGSVLGGSLGERWHTKLAARAADPAYGPEAAARAEAEARAEERRHQLDRDAVVGHEAGNRHRQDDTVDVRDGRNDTVDVRDGQEPRYTASEWQARQGDGQRAPQPTPSEPIR